MIITPNCTIPPELMSGNNSCVTTSASYYRWVFPGCYAPTRLSGADRDVITEISNDSRRQTALGVALFLLCGTVYCSRWLHNAYHTSRFKLGVIILLCKLNLD